VKLQKLRRQCFGFHTNCFLLHRSSAPLNCHTPSKSTAGTKSTICFENPPARRSPPSLRRPPCLRSPPSLRGPPSVRSLRNIVKANKITTHKKIFSSLVQVVEFDTLFSFFLFNRFSNMTLALQLKKK